MSSLFSHLILLYFFVKALEVVFSFNHSAYNRHHHDDSVEIFSDGVENRPMQRYVKEQRGWTDCNGQPITEHNWQNLTRVNIQSDTLSKYIGIKPMAISQFQNLVKVQRDPQGRPNHLSSNFQMAIFSVMCTPGMNMGCTPLNPQVCPSDYRICSQVAYRQDMFSIQGAVGYKFCTCLVTFEVGMNQADKNQWINYSMIDNQPHPVESATMVLETEAAVVRDMLGRLELGWNIATWQMRTERYGYPSSPYFIPRLEKLIIHYKGRVVFSLLPPHGIKLCPALGFRLMGLHISEKDNPCENDCGNFGFVDFIYPFPVHSLNYKELREWNASNLREIGFYKELPLHVLQYIKPDVVYVARQVLMPSEVKLDRNGKPSGSYFRLDNIREEFSISRQELNDDCMFELELLYPSGNDISKISKSCPPPIALGERTPFRADGLDFEVRGPFWAFILYFDYSLSKENSVSFSFSRNRIVYRGVDMKVTIIKSQTFNYIPFGLNFLGFKDGKFKMNLLKMGYLLAVIEMDVPGITEDAEPKYFRFGYPTMCDYSTETVPDLDSRKEPVHIKLMFNTCSPSHCLAFLAQKSKDRGTARKFWMMNFTPSKTMMSALPIYDSRDGYANPLNPDKKRFFHKILDQMEIYKYYRYTRFIQESADEELQKYSRVFQVGKDYIHTRQKVSAFLYVFSDTISVEWYLADLRMPLSRLFQRQQRTDLNQIVDMDLLNDVEMPMALESPDQAEVADTFQLFSCRYASEHEDSIPPCFFAGEVLRNEVLDECVRNKKCSDVSNNVSVWYQCIRDPDGCFMPSSRTLQMTDRERWSFSIDFSLDDFCMITVVLTDKYSQDMSLQRVNKLAFLFQGLAVMVFEDFNFKLKDVHRDPVIVPLESNNSSFHTYRMRTVMDTFELFDLTFSEPDTQLNPIYQRTLPSKNLASQIHIDPLPTGNFSRIFFNCQPDWDMCIGRNPCYNHGQCVKGRCVCLDGYSGKFCEENSCSTQECQNGGSCIPKSTSPFFECRCESGWVGDHCQEIFDKCFSSPCQNGGSCSPVLNDFLCTCPADFTGKACQTQRNACERLRPCRNGASCHATSSDSSDASYRCECTSTFVGVNCTVAKATGVRLWRITNSMAQNNYPIVLALQTKGDLPFRCTINMQQDFYKEFTQQEFLPIDHSLKEQWRDRGYDVTEYNYHGTFYVAEFNHAFIYAGQYNVTYQCWNKEVNSVNYAQSYTVDANNNPHLCVPSVHISRCGASQELAQVYFSDEKISVSSVSDTACNDTLLQGFEWSIHHIDKHIKYPTERNRFRHPGVYGTENNFFVEADALTAGLWAIKVNLVKFQEQAGTVPRNKVCWVRVMYRPLSCVISGGNFVHVPQDYLTLDGSESRDLKNTQRPISSLQVQWYCWLALSGQRARNCLGPEQPLSFNNVTLNYHESHNENLLLNVDTYIFKLMISDKSTSRRCSAQQKIEVTKKGSLYVTIACIFNCHDIIQPQEKVSLRTICRNCQVKETLIFWYVEIYDESSTSHAFSIDWYKNTSFGANTERLIINPNVLTPSSRFKIIASIITQDQSVEPGRAEMSLDTNAPPSNGSCTVNPKSGAAGQPIFNISCENWYDDHQPLKYLIFQIHRQSSTMLSESHSSSKEKLILSMGDKNDSFSTVLLVEIADSLEMRESVKLRVTVYPPVSMDQESVVAYTENAIKLDESGLDRITALQMAGNIESAMQVISSTSSVINQLNFDTTNSLLKKRIRKVRDRLMDSMGTSSFSTITQLRQHAGVISSIAGGKRVEYDPDTTEKLLVKNKMMAYALRDLSKDGQSSSSEVQAACDSVLQSMSDTNLVASEKIVPPSLSPVDLFYPNTVRDYDVFDEERITFLYGKSAVVEKSKDFQKEALMAMYEALGRDMEPGESPKKVESRDISMWMQHVDPKDSSEYTPIGVNPHQVLNSDDSNYAVLPNMTELLGEIAGNRTVEVTVTTLKRNPYWWRSESAKNVTTDVVDINLRALPEMQSLSVNKTKRKIDIFLRRNNSDVTRSHGKAILLDWYQTLNHRRNNPKDIDITHLKITVPPGGFSQVLQIYPIPKVALATDRSNSDIVYRIPVKLFVYYRPEEKASIHHMQDLFRRMKSRVFWTVPHNKKYIKGREVDPFSLIAGPGFNNKRPVDWYVGILLHPETAKRLLNSTVLRPITGHSHKLMMPSAKSSSISKPMKLTSNSDTQDDPLTTIEDIYGGSRIFSEDEKEICDNRMTFHSCERHRFVHFEMTSFAARCIYWDEKLEQYSGEGCSVGPLSSLTVLHCQCDHLSLFAGSFLSIPSKDDAVMSITSGLVIKQNLMTIFVFIALFALYLYLLKYAYKQDCRDVKRRVIFFLEDNDPNDTYAYLVTIFTGIRYKAGTTARVGMIIYGSEGETQPHLLTGEKKRHRCLERASDSWFLLTTSKSLGNLLRIKLWHDNSGQSPEWLLERVLVRDCQTEQTWVFLHGSWIHAVNGLEVVRKPAALHQMLAWNKSITRRAEESLREDHLWFSVFSRPLSSVFTRCQRLSCAMCMLAANIIVSLVFYGLPTGDGRDQISQHSSKAMTFQDFMNSAESAVIVTVVVVPIVLLFRNTKSKEDISRKIVFPRKYAKRIQENDAIQKVTFSTVKHHMTFHDSIKRFSMIRESISIKNHMADSSAGTPDGIYLNSSQTEKDDEDDQQVPFNETMGKLTTESRSFAGDMLNNFGRRNSDKDVEDTTDTQATQPKWPEYKDSWKLPHFFNYISWLIVESVIVGCLLLSALYSIRMGQMRTYVWLTSSGISIVQGIFLIQPMLIVCFSWIVTIILRQIPSIERRRVETKDWKSFTDINEAYFNTINAKRTTPMYRPVPERKLRKMRAKKNRDLLTREAIKDIITFILYISSLLYIIHGNRNTQSYLSTSTVHNMLVEGLHTMSDDDAVYLTDVSTMNDMFQYIGKTLIPSLYMNKKYNGSEHSEDGTTTVHNLHMLGVPRFRQVRISRNRCKAPDELFFLELSGCHKDYMPNLADTEDYGQRWRGAAEKHSSPWDNEATEAWVHKSAITLDSMSTVGYHGIYPGSGYVLHLGRTANASQIILKYMRNSGWIDLYTKVLFVEMTLYNAESDLFNLVTILFERNSIGSVTPTCHIKTSKLFIDTNSNTILLWMMAFYVAFLIFNTLLEMRKLRQIGCKTYFNDIWCLVDICVVMLGYSCAVLHYVRFSIVKTTIDLFRDTDHNKFANFHNALYWDYILTYAQAFTLLMTLLKFWKILTFNKRMLTFSLTLRHSKPNLMGFCLVFLITILAFAYLGLLGFHGSVEEYKTLGSSLMTLLLMSIGSFEASSYISLGNGGMLFFVVFTFFVTINLINVLLAIIMEGYERAIEDMKYLSTKYDVVDVFIWEIKNFFADSSSDSSENDVDSATPRHENHRKGGGVLHRLLCCCGSQTKAERVPKQSISEGDSEVSTSNTSKRRTFSTMNTLNADEHMTESRRAMLERCKRRRGSKFAVNNPMFLDSIDGKPAI